MVRLKAVLLFNNALEALNIKSNLAAATYYLSNTNNLTQESRDEACELRCSLTIIGFAIVPFSAGVFLLLRDI